VIASGGCGTGGETTEQGADGHEVDLRLAVDLLDHVILTQATGSAQDGEGALHHPSARRHHNRALPWLLAHDLDGDPALPLPPVNQVA
jgi:hypothetical protein